MKDAKTIRAELAMPFAPEDLEWRLQKTTRDNSRGLAVPYVTNRAIQDRLDEVVGPENWYNDYKPWHGTKDRQAQICGIAVYFAERDGYITKWDGAEDSDIEPIKGGLSDSMKRAAVQWGIGRVLYKMDTVWVDVEPQGKSYVIKASERSRLDKAYTDMLSRLNLAPSRPSGLQSQLTPLERRKETPDNRRRTEETQTDTAESGAAPLASDKERAPTGKTACVAICPEYAILDAKTQTGISGQKSVSLTLRSAEGKQQRVYAKGEHPELVQGVLLYDVKLERLQQDNVVFYALRTYKVLHTTEKAA